MKKMTMVSMWLVAFVVLNVWARSSAVTSCASSGDGTLRHAIAIAEDGDTIRILCNRVFLTNQLEIAEGRFSTHGIIIEGESTTLDGQGLCRILYVGRDNKLSVRNVNFENGHGPDLGQGGAIYNLGDISIVNAVFKNNGVYVGYTLWNDTVSGSGGAIYNEGKISVNHASAMGNVTSNCGGVLFNVGGEVALNDVEFSNNTDGKKDEGEGSWGIYSRGGCLDAERVQFTGICVDSQSHSFGGAAIHAGGMDTVALKNCDFSENCRSNDYPLIYIDTTNFMMSCCAISNTLGGGENCVCYFQNASVSNVVYKNNQGQFLCSSKDGGNGLIIDSQFDNNEGEVALELAGHNVTVDHCDFTSNQCAGGAIGIGLYSHYRSSSNVVVRNSDFKFNHASSTLSHYRNDYGNGAITGFSATESMVLNCSFASNSSDGSSSAGAIGGVSRIMDCVFSNNVSCVAGAVVGGNEIRNCLFVNNVATNGSGGAISAGKCFIDSCVFSANRAINGNGGAISCASRTANRAIITNCSFDNNCAEEGGALSGIFAACNNVFWKNSATKFGSVVSSYSSYYSDYRFCLANSTFIDNDNDYLVYGSGVLIGNVAFDNGKFDYYVPKPKDGYFIPSASFSIHSGKIDGVEDYWLRYKVLSVFGVFTNADIESDMFCSEAGRIQIFEDRGSGVDRIYCLPKSTGDIPGRGAFVWHDEEWDNIAYSMSKDSKKRALVGVASNATICVDRDYLGQEIKYPACPGAVYCPATSVITHTVSFDTLGGSEIASVDIENGVEVGQLPTPVREGFWLYGWYADPDFKTAVNQDTQIVEDRIFYARWIPDVQPDGGPYPQIVNGIEWTYFVSNGLSCIKSSSAYAAAITNTIVGEVVVPEILGGHVVSEIGEYAFRGCNKMTDIVIPDSVVKIGSSAFYGCSELLEVSMPDGVTQIADGLFHGCSKLKTVKMSECTTQIGSMAFYDCYQLSKIAIPASVTNIGGNAFSYCSKLDSIVIPVNVSSIGYDAFYYCVKLDVVKFYGHLPSGVDNSLLLSNATEVYYPREYADEYEAVVSAEIFAGYTDEENAINVTFNYGPFADRFEEYTKEYTVGAAFHDFPMVTRAKWHVKGWYTQPVGGERCDGGDVLPFLEDGTLYLQADYLGDNPGPGDNPWDGESNVLSIVTAPLPNAVEMEWYESQLEYAGGVAPYSWSIDGEGYLVTTNASTFAEVGKAMGWLDDGGVWNYDLPFAFNLCGRAYETVEVNDDGYLSFGNGDNYTEISLWVSAGDLYAANKAQDIFVERASEHVTFRWSRVLYSEEESAVNYSITLYSNGVIRCSFGDCYNVAHPATIYDEQGLCGKDYELVGSGDIVFTPNYLPSGLSLDETGTISGIPEQAGHYEFEVSVQDANGSICTKTMAVDVAANANRPPVTCGYAPTDDAYLCLRGGESISFGAEAADPECGEVQYSWYLDGEEINGATGASYKLNTSVAMRGWHELTCKVSDGLWTVVAHKWEFPVGGEQHVSAEDGADALQNALDNAVSGDVIYVGPGTYSPIVDWSHNSVRIVATDGCDETFIDGGETASCVRVSWRGSTNRMVRLEGFTLENGYVASDGGVYGAWLIGCIVRNNEAAGNGGGMCYGRADSCLIVGNSANYGGGTFCTELHNCTIVGNVSTYSAGGSHGGDKYNTIIWGNTGTYDDSNVDNPLFVDPGNGDYSLSVSSPCIGMGENSDVATEYDLAGNVRIQQGCVDLGAFESAYALPTPHVVTDLDVSPRTYGFVVSWPQTMYAKTYRVYRAAFGGTDELVATTASRKFEDTNAVFGVAYTYWVVSCNEVGDSAKSAEVTSTMLSPLTIADSKITNAAAGNPYEYALRAEGGDGSYCWYAVDYVAALEDVSMFAESGEPMGWHDDGCSWNYVLPFGFPIGNSTDTAVEVSDDGYLCIAGLEVYAAADADLDLSSGDIFVAEGDGAVTFRWKGVQWDTDDRVAVSATLYEDGRIRLCCDADSTMNDRSVYLNNEEYWSGHDGDIVLTPNALPAGMELNDDGVLSGMPATAGTYCFVVRVMDGNEEFATGEIAIEIAPNPIPDIGDNPTEEQIATALAGSEDEKLATCVTNAEIYTAYRTWAESVATSDGSSAAGAQAVKDSPNAWVSFALGSDRLLEAPPTDEDLKVEKFEPSSEAGKFDFTVSVEGVEVGSEALEENLKQVFGLEGAATLDPTAFASDNVDLTFGTPENGKVKFTAGPKDTETKTFFMKVRVNP